MKRIDARKIAAEFERVFKEDVSIREESDNYGNIQLWIHLKRREEVVMAARIVRDMGGRCVVISAYAEKDGHVLLYHYDIGGVVVNVEVEVKDGKIDAVTPILKSADWAERELKEMYGIELIGHPNPARLFLDESIAEGILNEYIPLSAAMNGATTCDMWNRIDRERGES
ncbi:NADH-quinone oxidoreductase subunit C [Hydrogenimonas sp.]|jgi:Ni,Fe-hydrogenase III component G